MDTAMDTAAMIIKKARKNLFDKLGDQRCSEWEKGVVIYADELLDTIAEAIENGTMSADDLKNSSQITSAALNGMGNWKQYSYAERSLVYESDIARRLCAPSELERTNYGEYDLNSYENWIDVQARALEQAEKLLQDVIRKALEYAGA